MDQEILENVQLAHEEDQGKQDEGGDQEATKVTEPVQHGVVVAYDELPIQIHFDGNRRVETVIVGLVRPGANVTHREEGLWLLCLLLEEFPCSVAHFRDRYLESMLLAHYTVDGYPVHARVTDNSFFLDASVGIVSFLICENNNIFLLQPLSDLRLGFAICLFF